MEGLFGRKKRAPGGALVLYTTRHGATQRYAERIAQPLDALVKDAAYAKIGQAQSYDAIVLGCCVYGGRIKGLAFFERYARELADKRLVIFICGLYDPQLEEVRAPLERQLREQLGDMADRIPVFYLRGGIRWQNLGLVERVMLKAMVAQMKKKPEQERTLIENQMIQTEGGAIDFSDEADLGPVVHAARFGREAEA